MQHYDANLEAVIEARKLAYSSSEIHYARADVFQILRKLDNFEDVTGLEKESHLLPWRYADLNKEAGVNLPLEDNRWLDLIKLSATQ